MSEVKQQSPSKTYICNITVTTLGSIMMISMLTFQNRYLKWGSLYQQGGREKELEPDLTICKETNQKARNTLHFFLCVCLKQHSRQAPSHQRYSNGIFHHCPPHSQGHCAECGHDNLACNSPVWKRDFSTSGGMATAQLKIPAKPPAKRILGTLRSLTLCQGWGGWKTEERGEKKEKKQYIF